MKAQFEKMFKEGESAMQDIVDFNKDVAVTIHKSCLQASQAVLDGYSAVLAKALAECDKTPAQSKPKPKAKPKASTR